MIYKFDLGHNPAKATNNICCMKDEDVVDFSTTTSWLKKFLSSRKNLNNQARLGGPKTVDFKAMRGCPHGIMVKAMDCGIIVSEFVIQSRYYIHFQINTLGKGMNPPYPPSYWLNNTTTVLLREWLWH